MNTTRSLPPGTEGPVWESRLIKDLAFIKKRMRYPLSARTLAPTLLISFITLLAFRVIITTISFKNREFFLPVFIVVCLFVPVIVSTIRYIKTLKFRSIPTLFSTTENAQLIEAFLRAEQLVTFRNAESPEIFQIISKSVNNYKDQREVMIFIADDNRILINSHFTNSGFNFVPAAPHTAGMANMLQEWIKANTDNANRDIVSINTF